MGRLIALISHKPGNKQQKLKTTVTLCNKTHHANKPAESTESLWL